MRMTIVKDSSKPEFYSLEQIIKAPGIYRPTGNHKDERIIIFENALYSPGPIWMRDKDYLQAFDKSAWVSLGLTYERMTGEQLVLEDK